MTSFRRPGAPVTAGERGMAVEAPPPEILIWQTGRSQGHSGTILLGDRLRRGAIESRREFQGDDDD
ncbi:MAG: hypothetical protein NTNFB02_32400 [Nitrospira sp.]